MYEHSNDKGWETFKIEPLGGLMVAFKTYHGTYVYATKPRSSSRSDVLSAGLKNGAFSEDAKFIIVPQSDGTFGLKTKHNTYVRRSPEGKNLNQQNFVGGWEKFKFAKNNNEIYNTNAVLQKIKDISTSTSKKVQLFTLGKCGLKLDRDIGNNEKDAVWDCNGNADTLELVNNKLYRHIGNTKCGLEWDSNLSNGERNAKFDCKGTADPINIQGNKIYTNVGSTKCGLEWDSQLKNNKRNAKWDCKGTADAVEIREISKPNLL